MSPHSQAWTQVVQRPLLWPGFTEISAARTSARVSLAERKQAVKQAREIARVQRLGVQAGVRIGFRLQAAILRAYRQRRSFSGIVQEHIDQLMQPLIDAMVASHLVGGLSAAKNAANNGHRAFARSVYQETLEMLRRRAEISPEEIAVLNSGYRMEAFKVLSKLDGHIERKLSQAVLETVEEGMHVREGAAHIAKQFDAIGFNPQSSYTAEAIFRTQTSMAYSAGRYQTQQDPVIQEILWGYTYVTAGDDRVRPEHVGLDGTTLPKEDPMWGSITPPNGWACRCQLIDVFRPTEEVHSPEEMEVDGKMVRPGPDPGFDFNPGARLDETGFSFSWN